MQPLPSEGDGRERGKDKTDEWSGAQALAEHTGRWFLLGAGKGGRSALPLILDLKTQKAVSRINAGTPLFIYYYFWILSPRAGEIISIQLRRF